MQFDKSVGMWAVGIVSPADSPHTGSLARDRRFSAASPSCSCGCLNHKLQRRHLAVHAGDTVICRLRDRVFCVVDCA